MNIKNNPNFCNLCKYFTKNKCNLYRHIREKHYNLFKYNRTKKFCYANFKRKSHLRDHINIIHENLKLFKCYLCEKNFKTRSNLHKHLRKVCKGNVIFSLKNNNYL